MLATLDCLESPTHNSCSCENKHHQVFWKLPSRAPTSLKSLELQATFSYFLSSSNADSEGRSFVIRSSLRPRCQKQSPTPDLTSLYLHINWRPSSVRNSILRASRTSGTPRNEDASRGLTTHRIRTSIPHRNLDIRIPRLRSRTTPKKYCWMEWRSS